MNLNKEMLIQSLQLLASDFETQCSVFPNFVHIPDEIALMFDDMYFMSDQFVKDNIISDSQKRLLDDISNVFDKMSNCPEEWTIEALSISTKWQKIRYLADSLLDSFGRPKGYPNLFWLHFVEGKSTK